MSDEPKSLILPDPEQPELLPQFDGLFSETEEHGVFTGERLFKRRPDTYKAVVVLLGQGLGVKHIAKLLSVSPATVLAVRDREGASVEAVKEHLAKVANAGATLAGEAIVERLATLRAEFLDTKDLKELGVIFGILTEKGQLLAGQPTARVEVSDLKRPEHDDFNAYIRALPQANVSAVVTPATHLDGKISGAKEAGQPGDQAAAPDASPDQARAPGTDAASDV